MNELPDGKRKSGARFVVELFGGDPNGRKMIAWGQRFRRGLRGQTPSAPAVRAERNPRQLKGLSPH